MVDTEFSFGDEIITTNLSEMKANACPPALLDQIGVALQRSSRNRFRNQEFDGTPWAGRYPSLPEAMLVNIAGLLSDFQEGKTPQARRFTRRPAAVDTNQLQQSISFEQTGPCEVTVKAGKETEEYADLIQSGGQSSIPMTDNIRKALNKFLKKEKNKRFRPVLGPLFQETIKTTDVNSRQYIGISRKDEKVITQIIREFYGDQ